MRKIKYKKGRKLQPYNLEYTGIHKKTDSEMQLFVYDDHNLAEFEDFNVSDLKKNIDVKKTNWLNIHGLNDLDFLKSISDYFEIDNFLLADILNPREEPKLKSSMMFYFSILNHCCQARILKILVQSKLVF